MNTELERMWKETVLAFFKAVSWHLSGETRENNRNVGLDSWCLIGIGVTCLLDASNAYFFNV
jgi:hypothetical protein